MLHQPVGAVPSTRDDTLDRNDALDRAGTHELDQNGTHELDQNSTPDPDGTHDRARTLDPDRQKGAHWR